MLTMEEAIQVGKNACAKKFGVDFIESHKDQSAFAYSKNDNATEVFCFAGIDDEPLGSKINDLFKLDSTSIFKYHVSCTVKLSDGEIVFHECVVPQGDKS